MKTENRINLIAQVLRIFLGSIGFLAVIYLRFTQVTQEIHILWLVLPTLLMSVKAEELPKLLVALIQAWKGK